VLKKRDWLWLILFPVYLVIGTFRHELAHALCAHWQGAEILSFTFWPSLHKNGNFYFGYVSWRGPTTWHVLAAPYVFDVLTTLVFYPITFFLSFKARWIWINLVIIGVISPWVNSAYNYLRGSDVRKLMAVLPPTLVHGVFLLWLGISLMGLVVLFFRSKHSQSQEPEQ
jgi:hypothetical protein